MDVSPRLPLEVDGATYVQKRKKIRWTRLQSGLMNSGPFASRLFRKNYGNLLTYTLV